MQLKPILLAALALLCGCAPGWGAGLQTANTIANGVACGMAAANGTPCTSQAVLDALARDAAAQRAKVQAIVPQASATNEELTRKLLEQLEANTASNRAITEALIGLAMRPTSSCTASVAPPLAPPPAQDEAPAGP